MGSTPPNATKVSFDDTIFGQWDAKKIHTKRFGLNEKPTSSGLNEKATSGTNSPERSKDKCKCFAKNLTEMLVAKGGSKSASIADTVLRTVPLDVGILLEATDVTCPRERHSGMLHEKRKSDAMQGTDGRCNEAVLNVTRARWRHAKMRYGMNDDDGSDGRDACPMGYDEDDCKDADAGLGSCGLMRPGSNKVKAAEVKGRHQACGSQGAEEDEAFDIEVKRGCEDTGERTRRGRSTVDGINECMDETRRVMHVDDERNAGTWTADGQVTVVRIHDGIGVQTGARGHDGEGRRSYIEGSTKLQSQAADSALKRFCCNERASLLISLSLSLSRTRTRHWFI